MLQSMRDHDSGGNAIRILLIGAAGQVGSELRHTLAPLGDIVPTDRAILDLTDEDAIRRTIRSVGPDLIVNAAAYTQVDPAEAEPELAVKVNGRAPGIMAEEARRANAALIHYSTDYVFSGSIQRPYREDDEPDPINAYGKTKLAGEHAIAAVGAPHLILRTSWVFGTGGKNFFNTIIKLAREREELKVVDDQIGSPNWSRAAAKATAEILSHLSSRGSSIVDAITEVSGIYHLCGAEHTSRFGFAKEILALYRQRAEAEGLPPLRLERLIAVPTTDFPSAAKRPHYSVLSPEKIARTFGVELLSWRAQLAHAFEEDALHHRALVSRG
jgi:dTDP-4-dehydrorhamnose reductase